MSKESFAIVYDGSKNKTPEQVRNSLDLPGAGIPAPARFILRNFIKPLIIRRQTWEQAEKLIHENHRKILREIKDLDTQALTTCVLVPKQRGLEDSSRYWSIAMVLRHLMIVGSAAEAFVVTLGNGKNPDRVADTALVKPEIQHYDLSIVSDYEKFSSSLVDRIQKAHAGELSSLGLNLTHLHPWFGEMNAKDWFWLIGMHTGLHLKQIREIKKALLLYS